MSDKQTTKLGRSWLFKTMLFLLLLVGFGCWGLTDALYFYKRRGELDASIKFAKYLQAAQAVGSLTPSKLKCDNPASELAALKAKRADIELRLKSPSTERDAVAEQRRLVWLESLALMWQGNSKPKLLDREPGPPSRKIYFNMVEGEGEAVSADGSRTKLSPPELLGKLATKLNTTANVTPLSPLDMLFQWIFVVVGFGGGLYILATFARAAAKKYTWEPDAQRLTLPDGTAFVPSDIKEFDKRLWHKFFVTIHLKDGKAKTFDLLRYVPLEDWVVAMEKTAFPDAAPAEDPSASGQNPVEPVPNN